MDATLKTLVDIVPQFIFWKDINSIFQGCNRKFAHAAKLKSPDDIIHKTDRDMPWAVNAEKFLRDDQNVLYSGEPMLRYDEKQNIEGNERIMRVDTVPLIVNKEVQGLLGVYEDVTEVRTLKNDIQIAVRDKNQSSQFVDDFILNMQHDIRTPLTGIIGLGEIISNMEKEDIVEIKNASKDIISSGNRLLRYCESMVDYHKMNKSNEALVDKPIVVTLSNSRWKGVYLSQLKSLLFLRVEMHCYLYQSLIQVLVLEKRILIYYSNIFQKKYHRLEVCIMEWGLGYAWSRF